MRKALVALATAALSAAPALATHVPFVGCASDGQTGPRPIPRAGPTPDLPPAAAARLAYYAGPDVRVLAPRGWHCFETYGSNGSNLYVAPEAIDRKRIGDADVLSGPAIQLSWSAGSTSGRFEVAAVAARLFPAARHYVDGVAAEGIADRPFVRHPYPTDKITHRGPYEALYTTPAGRSGLGTMSNFNAGELPIDGLVILHPESEMDMLKLSSRLPTAQRPLVAYIIAQVKKER